MPPLPDPFTTCIAPWPERAQIGFVQLRTIVLTVARRAGIGEITETLKWGHPAWLPATPRTGSTLRCGWHPRTPDRLSLYVHCQTTLAETMRSLHPDAFTYEGSRALHMTLKEPLPQDAIDHCAFLTLTYHRKTA